MQNVIGQAKKDPKTANELVYAIISDACRRFLEGSIREHRSYSFYSGFQIKIFITKPQYALLEKLSYGEDPILMVNGKVLGEWSTWYFQGKWSCQLILTLAPEFEKKHGIIKRFAELAVNPLSKETELHYCSCGFPMVKPVNGDWLCDTCWRKQNNDVLFVF